MAEEIAKKYTYFISYRISSNRWFGFKPKWGNSIGHSNQPITSELHIRKIESELEKHFRFNSLKCRVIVHNFILIKSNNDED